MWSDNETLVDLCGFEYLVDQLEVVLTRSELRPITVGLSGGWGSGKSSLMGMAEERLDRSDRYICCSFSPWRYEDYDDVKHALMTTILAALGEKVESSDTLKQRAAATLAKVRELASRLRIPKLVGFTGATAVGVDPVTAAAVGEAAQVAAESAPEPATDDAAQEHSGSPAAFRAEFETLMDELGDDVEALVVFIDDLDRCLPETVIDTLEAIRLFVHVPKTGYVIAADPRAVRAAVASHYPEQASRGEDLGIDYLEKMWQFTITIPPLSVPEVETFVNLLFASLDLRDEDFEKVHAAAATHRTTNQLAVAMNHGVAADALDGVPADLAAHFELTRQIAPQLAQGLRGNPREIKRFLNTLLLRLETAKKRDIALEPDVLAKLMILEERQLPRFKELFEWQLEGDGIAAQLAQAEKGEGDGEWANDGPLAAWLPLDPPLGEVLLSPYFSFSRDRLSAAAPASRLSADLQALLPALLGESDSLRDEAKRAVLELAPAERAALFDVALERAVRKPTAPALRALGEIAKADDALVAPLLAAIGSIPAQSMPLAAKAQYDLIFKDDPRFTDVFPPGRSRRAKKD